MLDLTSEPPMHPLHTFFNQLLIAMLLVGSIHTLAVWLRQQLRRASPDAQTLILAIGIVWVVSAGPSVLILVGHQIAEAQALLSAYGIHAAERLLTSAVVSAPCRHSTSHNSTSVVLPLTWMEYSRRVHAL